jgi:crotonobetainyl-CoA:carnitine CoA-transferase CaiB-like acyl-CoA transferase
LTNADKRSLELDLKTKPGAAALKELIRSADVLVENLKAGTLSKFGFSPAEALKLNPRLVYCSVTGFGAHSLYAQRPAFDMVIQAMSGFMAALRPGGIPLKSGVSTADTMGAEMAILGVLAALEYRDRTGVGQHIDLSMQDITGWMTQTAWNRGAGESARPEVFACADGYVVAETQGREPARVFGVASETERQKRAAVMTREEVARVLGKAGIPAAPVLALREAASHPQTQARRNWFKAAKDGVDWPMLASPLRLLVTPPEITRLAPDLNEDGPAILAELGLERTSRA